MGSMTREAEQQGGIERYGMRCKQTTCKARANRYHLRGLEVYYCCGGRGAQSTTSASHWAQGDCKHHARNVHPVQIGSPHNTQKAMEDDSPAFKTATSYSWQMPCECDDSEMSSLLLLLTCMPRCGCRAVRCCCIAAVCAQPLGVRCASRLWS